MPLGAGIMAAGSLGGALIQGSAAQSAAQTQANAQMAVAQMAQQNLGPLLARGTNLAQSVTPQLQALLTPGQSASALSQLPGYAWADQVAQTQAKNYGTQMGLGGNALYGLTNMVSGVNQQYENQYFNQLYSTLTAGLQTATNAAGTLTGAVGSALTGAGNAQAAGTLAAGQAAAGGLSGLSTAGLIYALKSGSGLFGNSAAATD